MWMIEPMRAQDVPEVYRIETESIQNPWSEKALAEELDNSLAVFFVARGPEGIRGYYGLHRVLDEADLVSIAVDARSRRQGLGTLLMTHMLDWCRENGMVRLMLEVRLSNASARALYTRFGFVEDGIRRGYYQNPKEDAMLMSWTTEEGTPCNL